MVVNKVESGSRLTHLIAEDISMLNAQQAWEVIGKKNGEYLGRYDHTAFVAGGGLVLQFGNEDSKIWQDLVAKAASEDGEAKISIASVEFKIAELAQLGDFYRWLHDSKEYFLHCIDERLEESDEHAETMVHHKCGACGATHAARGYDGSCEDELADELKQPTKQPIMADMEEAHDSIAIHVDTTGQGRASKQEKRDEMKKAHALAFNVSLPLELMMEYCSENDLDFGTLTELLVRWNVKIARVIIGGHHNLAHQQADQAFAIIDRDKQADIATSVYQLVRDEVSKIVNHQIELVA